MTDVGSALESLTQALKKRERELDEREAELSEQQKRLKTEIISAYGDTSPSDVIHLNVGGKRLDVLRRTLCSVEGSMLASKFSGRWDDSLEKDRDGNFFLDHDFDDFKMMIDFLPNKAIESPKFPVLSPKGGGQFYRLLEYYGMTDGVYPTRFVPCYEPDGAEVEVTKAGRIYSNEWATFELVREGHTRNVKSIEIRLGKCERLQFGIQYLGGNNLKFDYSQSTGVGDIANTCAIDTVRSCALNAGHRTDISGMEVNEGSIIKLEEDNWYVDGELFASTNWYVDGELVASTTAKEGIVKMNRSTATQNYGQNYGSKWALSIKGEAQLISIDYCQ